ncbi:hypothetical protein O3M35_009834 [Rhynocoris fuscipes]|uniref:Uncharacterized protein n=1 Tax=Rhynocoris fuscipes TaxID=488301 RepID=A0AAW1D5U6_9HEMI
MCPAPAPLHLERYIGSCLISAGYHHHHHHHHNNSNNFLKKESQHTRYRRYTPQSHCHQNSEYCTPGNGNISTTNGGPSVTSYPRTWTTAGLPLISMSPASPRRAAINNKDKQQDERSPLSRLAIHTQGAPLIQAGRQQTRIIKQNGKQPKKEKDQKDFSSVVSDESSGNSENSLPRIIKPRKRRKKDRKPQQANGTVQSTQTSTEAALQETAIVTLKPYTPLCQDFTPQNKTNNSTVTNNNNNNEQHNEEGSINKILNELPIDESINARCQCRYCDPINLTWDVDQRCYSPYLTPPASYSPSSSQDWDLDSRESSLEVSSEIITSPNGHRDIEIKFFSASPQATKNVQPVRQISVTPPWQN